MKKIFNKIICLTMVTILVFGAAPLSGFVGLELPEFSFLNIKVEAASNGTCGDNLTWSFKESTGDLIIDGNGEMYDYYDTGAPWKSFRDNIKKISIGSGVTSIGERAFYNCNYITDINIPGSVELVNICSFGECDDLKSVTLGYGVKFIGKEAFGACPKLTEVNFSNTVAYIGYHAFAFCESLAEISLPDTVINIDSEAFYSTPLYNKKSNWIDNYFYIGNHLIDVKPSNTGKYTIKDGTITIAMGAFDELTDLTEIVIPDSVKSIDAGAFYGCSNLTKVVLPETIDEIQGNMFEDCTSLKYIDIPDTVTSIGSDAFKGCSSLKSIVIPSGVTKINDRTFWNCSALEKVIIPDCVTSIGGKAFENCTNLTDITLPENLISIGGSAFSYCINLTDIIIPNRVISIGGSAFTNCDSLKSIIIPDTVTEVGSSVFGGCDKLVEVSTNILNYEMFRSCKSLKNVKLKPGITTIPDGTFSSCDGLENIVLPDGVIEIGKNAFSYCSSLTTIKVPVSLQKVGAYAFYDGYADMPLTTYYKGTNEQWSLINISTTWNHEFSADVVFECDSAKPYYDKATSGDKIDWILYESGELLIKRESEKSIYFTQKKHIKKVVFGDEITSIKDNAFSGCENLAEIEIPDGIEYVGDNAFTGTAIYNDESNWFDDSFYIDNCLVDSRVSDSDCIVKDGTKTIYQNAFNNNKTLKRIFIPDSVKKIFDNAFEGTDITIICNKDSYAHQYARDNGIDFEIIEVSFDKTNLNMKKGDFAVIIATVKEDYFVPVEYTWKTSNTSVATVDSNGKVTAINYGEAIISAVSSDGIVLATCSVKILPTEPAFADVIITPTETTISYGDAIILHVDKVMIPEGGRVEWTADNGNFVYSANGETCKINPNKTGDTTFTVVVYDSYGNAVSTDSQTMTSKAGFFDKVIAFFKGLFGMTKTIPQVFKGII